MPRKKKEEILDEEILLENEEDFEDEEDYTDDEDEYVEEEYEDEDENENELEEATAASQTLQPNGGSGSKAEMMQTLMNAMSGMSNGDMIKFFDMVMSQHASFNSTIPNGASAQNQASIAMKGSPVKEDLELIFGEDSEQLSEEFKEKVETLFEASLNSRLQIEIARLEEEYDEKLREEIEEITSNLEEDVNDYLEYISKSWLEENRVAVDISLRTQLAENFIRDMGHLCREYNLDLPEGQDDVIETLTTTIGELEESLNESENRNIELCEHVNELEKQIIIEHVADELPAMKYEKFVSLAENIEFDGDSEKFNNKLEHIKNSLLESSKSTKVNTNLISEEIAENDEGEDNIKFVDPAVKKIYESISRTSKR